MRRIGLTEWPLAKKRLTQNFKRKEETFPCLIQTGESFSLRLPATLRYTDLPISPDRCVLSPPICSPQLLFLLFSSHVLSSRRFSYLLFFFSYPLPLLFSCVPSLSVSSLRFFSSPLLYYLLLCSSLLFSSLLLASLLFSSLLCACIPLVSLRLVSLLFPSLIFSCLCVCIIFSRARPNVQYCIPCFFDLCVAGKMGVGPLPL